MDNAGGRRNGSPGLRGAGIYSHERRARSDPGFDSVGPDEGEIMRDELIEWRPAFMGPSFVLGL